MAAAGQDLSVTANAEMLVQFLDALGVEQVDLVGNDSGGGIAQIFAARHPHRLRSLTLTDCDTHDNWPPEAFKPCLAMAAAGGLARTIPGMRRYVRFEGARIFFAEERWQEFNRELRSHWGED